MLNRFMVTTPLRYWQSDPPTGGGAAADPPANDSQSQTDPPTGGQPANEGKPGETVLQIPERELRGRINRETKRQLDEDARKLGYADHAALLAAAKAKADAEEAAKSELEKAQEAARKAADERDKALALANTRLIKARVETECGRLKVVDPDAAYKLMALDDVSVDDDGEVHGVTEALTALLEAKPYLKAPEQQSTGTGTGSGIPAHPTKAKTASEQSDEQRRARAYKARL